MLKKHLHFTNQFLVASLRRLYVEAARNIKMIQNPFWATGYNIIALPLAVGVAAERGILLNPAVSAIFMSLSTAIVAVNAVLLRKQVL